MMDSHGKPYANLQTYAYPISLFLLALIVLARTLVPTLYTFDSAELATAAYTLGFSHAPGYPLYLLLAHAFIQLPFDLDVAGKVNLFSALCLAGAAVGVYFLLLRLYGERWLAFGASLVWVWSYYVWSVGIIAEVYAAQALTLAWTAWALIALHDRGWFAVLRGGVLYGLALAIHPGSVLFAPAVMLAYVFSGVRLSQSMIAGLVCILLFSATLLYFPVRYNAGVSFSLLGEYNSTGEFIPINLNTPEGVLSVVRGAQFDDLFFNVDDSLLVRTAQFGGWLMANFLGVGVLIGVAGMWALRERKRLLIVWLTAIIPFCLFYIPYGAPDIETMLVPLYLLWIIVFAVGWQWFSVAVGRQAIAALFAYAILLLIVNFPLVDGSQDVSVRQRAEIMLNTMPENALIFGGWFDVVPLEYLQTVEQVRPDVRLYNLFLFEDDTLSAFLESTLADGQIVIVGPQDLLAQLPLPPVRVSTMLFPVPEADIDSLRLEAYVVTAQ